MATILRKVTHNTMYQIVGKVVAVTAGLIALRVIVAYLDTEAYGSYATAVAFLTFFSVLADMGFYLVMVQEISKPGPYSAKQSKINLIVTLRVISGLVVFGVAPVIALLFAYQAQTMQLILIGALAFFPLTINQVLVPIFQKELVTQKIVTAEITGRLALLGMYGVIVWLGGNLNQIMIAMIIANTIQFMITWRFARKYTKISLYWNKKQAVAVLRRAWPLAAVIIFNLIYFRIDAIMLSKMQGEIAVAIYSIAYKVLEIVTIIPTLILGLILPILTRNAAKGQTKAFATTFESTLMAIMTVGMPIVVGGTLLAAPIIRLLSDDKFPESVGVLQLLMGAIAVIFLGNIFNHGMIALEKQRTITWVYAIGAIVSIGTNLIAIPMFSYTGAAVTTIGVEALVMVLVGWSLRKHVTWKWPVPQLGRVVLATLLMAIVLWYIQQSPLFVTIPVGAAVYAMTLYLLGGIPRELIATLRPSRT